MSGKLLESISLAPIIDSQHKTVRVCEIFGEIYDLSRVFLCREKEGTSTTFKVLYAYVKKMSSSSATTRHMGCGTRLFQKKFQSYSTCINPPRKMLEREREGGNIQETSITLARCFSAHV